MKNFLLTFMTLFVAQGCLFDGGHSDTFQTDYVTGAMYEFVSPVFLMDDGLIVPPDMHAAVPMSLSQYEAERAARWSRVAAPIPAGTRLQVISVIRERSYVFGPLVRVRGKIILQNRPTREGDLVFISRIDRQMNPSVTVPQVDPTYLRRLP